MRTKFIIMTIILTSCITHLIPKPDLTQIQPTLMPLVETQPITSTTQNQDQDMTSKLQNLIEQAKTDLAQRLSVSITDITLLDAKDVTWSDSSLGCPQPGMAYAEVITVGYLILLQTNDQNYEYHAGINSEAFLCDNPSPPADGMPENT